MKISVAFLPVYQNPYQSLLRDALAKQGVEVTFLKGLPSPRWLRTHQGQVQVLHYHWLSGLYLRRAATPIGIALFLHRFGLARRLGYKIVWTAHNILPHRYRWLPVHAPIRRLMMHQADAVIAHCEYGRNELLRRFPRRKPTYVIPIGSYAGLYPLTLTPSAARAALNLSTDAFVYQFLGNITGYKGLEKFVEIFRAQAGEQDVVLIAGRNRDPGLVARLKRIAAQDARLKIWAEFIPDDEIQRFLLAADVMVLPFTDILTSSSVLTGMSYGLPMIAPALGCLPELISSAAGILYDAANPRALGAALRQIKTRDTTEMGQQARRIATALTWEGIAAQTAQVYRQCVTE